MNQIKEMQLVTELSNVMRQKLLRTVMRVRLLYSDEFTCYNNHRCQFNLIILVTKTCRIRLTHITYAYRWITTHCI